jgi:hypothetical protein
VYHVDNYPAGDAKMQAPRKGNGADFDPSGTADFDDFEFPDPTIP